MTKAIHATLQTHYDSPVNSTAILVRIQRTAGAFGTAYAAIGITTHDRNLSYNDGDGAVTYSSLAGFDPIPLEYSANLSIDPAEIHALIPAGAVGPIVEAEINAGLYDGADFISYSVNWKDLTSGRHEILRSGTIGKARMVNGLAVFLELREISQRLRQSACNLTSLTCRATYGDAICGVDFSGTWVSGTITSVGSEADRVFTDTSIAAADSYYVPGLVQFLTGANAGRSYEVESQASDVVSFQFPTAYDMQVGDTYRIRRDCGKRYIEDCIGKFSNGANFDGEPYIPVGDEAAMATPGATSPGANAGTESGNVFESPSTE